MMSMENHSKYKRMYNNITLTIHPWDLVLRHHKRYDKIRHCSRPVPNRHPVPTTPYLASSHRRMCLAAMHDTRPPMPPRMVWHYSPRRNYCHNSSGHYGPSGRVIHLPVYRSWIRDHCNSPDRRWSMHRGKRQWRSLWPMARTAKRVHQLRSR